MDGSSLVPAARGTVQVTKARDSEGTGYSVRLKVDHLAPAAQIGKATSVYVVWVKPTVAAEKALQNLGIFKVDSDLQGEFSVVLPHRNFDLFITPEVNAEATEPSGPKVMQALLSPMLHPTP